MGQVKAQFPILNFFTTQKLMVDLLSNAVPGCQDTMKYATNNLGAYIGVKT